MNVQKHAGLRKAARAMGVGLLEVFILLNFAVPCVYASASEAQSRTVTVRAGYFNNGDFMHKAQDGSYEGYDIEFYYTLAGYAGWKIQFVEYKSLESALKALENGEIDVMSGLSKTSERTQKFLVSDEKMCTAQIAVQTRANDDRFSPGDTASMENMTCGILKGSNVVSLYRDWCEKNGLSPHVVEYGSLSERNEALTSGKVDALAGGSTIAGAQKIAQFPSLDLFFMLNRNQTAYKKQLDRAMRILMLENPTYSTGLFLKYFPLTRNVKPSFSADEKSFIAAHPVIRVAVLENDAPFSSRDSSGNPVGILPEYYAHLSKVIGAEFRCVSYASKNDACAALSAGDVDLIGKYGNDVYDSNSRNVVLSVPYLKMNLVQITRAGTNEIRKTATPLCNEDAVSRALSGSAELETCENSEQCFAQLKSGKVDSVVCTQPAATWMLSRNRASDYVVLAFGGETWDTSCALPGSRENALRSILNKSITVDGGYINQLITADTLKDSANLADVFDRLPVSFLATAAIIAAVLLIIAGAALVVIIRRRKTERQLSVRRAELAAEEKTSRAKHAFFGAVSHDMRTPLNGIMGFADLALKSDSLPEIRDCLQKIRQSGSVLTDLVNDTLIMSRMENGKYVLHPAPVETQDILEGVVAPIRLLAEEKGVELSVDTSKLRPRCILADRLSLQKILLNLLSNALKATPSGGKVSVVSRLEPEDGDQPDTILCVSDTWAGITNEFLPHIFEPFAQENPDNADTSGGGMGLSIVKSIVDAMGGTIVAESRKGKGTSFTVRLHLTELASEPPKTSPDEPADTRRLRGKRVLVCEDNTLNMEIVRSLLQGSGMETVCVENGRLGVEAFQASQPGCFDAVLLDLRMPVLDGVSAAREIRALSRSDALSVPLIAVSADAYEDDVKKCLDAGMNGHIAKPINPDSLFRTLLRLIPQESRESRKWDPDAKG